MDSTVLLFSVFYLVVLGIGIWMIRWHHSPPSLDTDSSLQKSKLVYGTVWATLIVFSLIMMGMLTKSETLLGVIAVVGLFVLPLLFVFAAIGICIYGVGVIVKGETVVHVGGVVINSKATGFIASIWGAVYLLAGLMLCSLLVSFFEFVACYNRIGICQMLSFIDPVMNFFNTSIVTKWMTIGISILAFITTGIDITRRFRSR